VHSNCISFVRSLSKNGRLGFKVFKINVKQALSLAFVVGFVGCATSQHGVPQTFAVTDFTTAHALPRSTAPPAGYLFPGLVGPATGSGFKTLHTFGAGTDAAGVQAKMLNVGGLLYGTSHGGGATGNGTVFTFDPKTKAEHVIYSFMGGSDGLGPSAPLLSANGMLYGTTSSVPEPGFPNGEGNGTVFAITTSGAETVLHAFTGSPDGANPEGYVTNVNGVLYGTTFVGGTGSCNYSSSAGCGTVFMVDPSTGNESVIYSFQGGADGAGPRAGMAYLNGTLYGDTYFGGANSEGTVFSITPGGAESVLHSFAGGSDGAHAQSALEPLNGIFYGTTNQGGSTGYGVVYSVTTGGAESVVQSICCGPEGGLFPLNGTLYGTTSGNGSSTSGNVYSLTLAGAETVLHSFTGGTNGASPEDTLTNVNGVLYGTTRLAGANGVGTVFKINP
jgi:uncharacterized repeat protein (TIGR03803 family)